MLATVAKLVPATTRNAALVLAILNVLLVLALMAVRLPYPFEIEWMEGGMLEHVRRLVAGERIYVAPSLEFIPFIYPPGFYYASALLTPVFGDGFLPLRVVSAAASIGILILIFRLVSRETGAPGIGIIAAGLFAATYAVGGAWFDVGRVDMLFLFLILAAFSLIGPDATPRDAAAGGLLLAAAILTKQSGIVMAAPAVGWLLLARRRTGVIVLVSSGIAVTTSVVGLNWVHDGWFSYYVFQLPSHYSLVPRSMLRFWTEDLLGAVPFLVVLSMFYLLQVRVRENAAFTVCVAIGLVGGSWMSRGNDGGWNNVLLPAFAAMSILAGLGLNVLSQSLRTDRVPAAAWPYLLVILQFILVAYDPRSHTPQRGSAAAGHRFVEVLRNSEGDVWVPYHNYLASMAGKPAHAHWMAVADILRYSEPAIAGPLRSDLTAAIEGRRFGLIVTSNRPFPSFPSLEPSYSLKGEVFDNSNLFWPLTGARRRPERIYVPLESFAKE